MIPDRIVDAQANEPAVQQVELQPFHQLAFRADRVERLQQRRPQQLLRRDRGPAQRRVHSRKVRAHIRQRTIRNLADSPKWMIFRYSRLQIDIREQ